MGRTGPGEGQLNFWLNPDDQSNGGVSVGTDGSVYVADSGNQRVQVFEPDGGFKGQWGSLGTAEGQFLDCMDLAVAPDGSVYVVDDLRDVIQRFSADGRYLTTIGSHGTGDGQLNWTGSVFVIVPAPFYNADTAWDNRVQAWGPDGSFLWSFGERGSAPGEFTLPADVGVDGAGDISRGLPPRASLRSRSGTNGV